MQEYSDNEDYTYCRLIEGKDEMFRLSSWELGLEIAKSDGWNWIPGYDYSYLVVLGDNRKLSDSPYVEWYMRGKISVSHEVLLHFSRTVPQEVQEVVGLNFCYSQIQLVKALRYCPELISLARSCPALFWLIVEKNSDVNILNSWNFTRLVRSKREEILGQLGYVGSKSAVKLLSKIKVGCFRDDDLFHLKDIMYSEEKIFLLRHYGELSRTHLYAAANHPDLLKYTFIRNELSRRNISLASFKNLASLCKDTCNMADMLGKEHIEDFLKTIKCPQQLESRHDSFARELHNTERNVELLTNLRQTYGKETFPQPPAGSLGGETLKPINSLTELTRLAEEFENCLLTWAPRIYEGEAFCFQILKPEKGIVGVDLTTGVPQITEIRLKRNQRPSPATVRAVEECLESMKEAQSGKLEREKIND